MSLRAVYVIKYPLLALMLTVSVAVTAMAFGYRYTSVSFFFATMLLVGLISHRLSSLTEFSYVVEFTAQATIHVLILTGLAGAVFARHLSSDGALVSTDGVILTAFAFSTYSAFVFTAAIGGLGGFYLKNRQTRGREEILEDVIDE